MQKINDLVELVFSGLSPLVIKNVADQGELIWVRARTPDGPAACPGCGTGSTRVHGYQWRTVADVPIAEAVLKEVAAHSACWAKAGPPPREGKRAATTRERWQQVHDLLNKGVGLLECSRRLGLALNTVKRYARVPVNPLKAWRRSYATSALSWAVDAVRCSAI